MSCIMEIAHASIDIGIFPDECCETGPRSHHDRGTRYINVPKTTPEDEDIEGRGAREVRGGRVDVVRQTH